MAMSNYKILKYVYSHMGDFKEKYNSGRGFYPLDAEIRVGWKCNARCKMCGLHSYIKNHEDRYSKVISVGDMLALLKQLHELRCLSVTFSGGEPTLCDGLAEVIKYAAKDCGMVTSINTNGYLLTREKIEEYIDSGLDSFTISILSPEEAINNRITGLKGGLSKIEKAIDYINEYSSKCNKNVKIFINNVLLNENIESLIKYKRFCKKHHITHLNFSPASILTEWDEWTASDEQLRPTKEQIKYLKKCIIPELQMKEEGIFVEDSFGDLDEEIEKNLHVVFEHERSRCYIAMIHIVVQCNGDIVPCCYASDVYIMGNILDSSFKEIWEGEKYRTFREECKSVKWDMCKSCRQYNKLNRKIEQKMVQIKQ